MGAYISPSVPVGKLKEYLSILSRLNVETFGQVAHYEGAHCDIGVQFDGHQLMVGTYVEAGSIFFDFGPKPIATAVMIFYDAAWFFGRQGLDLAVGRHFSVESQARDLFQSVIESGSQLSWRLLIEIYGKSGADFKVAQASWGPFRAGRASLLCWTPGSWRVAVFSDFIPIIGDKALRLGQKLGMDTSSRRGGKGDRPL